MFYIILYTGIMFASVWLYERKKPITNDYFLVANRRISGIVGSMSVASSWIWAPALYVSTQVGYQWGYSGLIWFIVPNMLALMIFAPFANLVRRKLPDGFSYIQHLQGSKGYFREVQLSVHLIVQVIILAIQAGAGSELISAVSGVSYYLVLLIIIFGPLSYCLLSGLSSSVFTDAIQYVLILLPVILIIFAFPEWDKVTFSSFKPFNPLDSKVLLEFGIASSLTLLFSIFVDHQQWQRVFAARPESVCKTFIAAGFMHGAVTFGLGTLGIILFSIGFKTANPQLIGVEYVKLNMGQGFTALFIIMGLCGLCSTINSCYCAFSSLYSTEIRKNNAVLRNSREAMICLAFLALVIGALRIPLITIWLTIGIIRLSAFCPTLASVLIKNFSGRVGTAAIFCSVLLGMPLFIYGHLHNDSIARTTGMLVSLVVGFLICLMERWRSGSTITTNPSSRYC